MSKQNYCIVLLLLLAGCVARQKFTYNYYHENDKALQGIKTSYQELAKPHPFSIEFKNKDWSKLGIEIYTDTMRYVYVFDTGSPALTDTLTKYGYNATGVNDLIKTMRRNYCTWITTLDYYEARQKKQLYFMSIRHKELNARFKNEKYFTLVFFNSAQPFDQKNRLLDKADPRYKRSINGEIFYKVNDSIAYTYSNHFR